MIRTLRLELSDRLELRAVEHQARYDEAYWNLRALPEIDHDAAVKILDTPAQRLGDAIADLQHALFELIRP